MVKFTLKHGAAGVVLARYSFSGGDVHVETDHITGGELPLGDLLCWCDFVDDGVITIDEMSIDLV